MTFLNLKTCKNLCRIIIGPHHSSTRHEWKSMKTSSHFQKHNMTSPSPLFFLDYSVTSPSLWKTVMHLFFHMTQLTLTGNRLGHFKNPSRWATDAIHLFSLIGLSETALRACITTLASEEKPCYHLSLVCFLLSGIDSLNKQEELCTCRYTCKHSAHTGASKQTTSGCQQYAHIT